MLDMIKADEARAIADEAKPNRERAAADTLSDNAINWAIRNCAARTDTRVRMYAKFGHYELSVKFAPGVDDRNGEGNSFYNDLVATRMSPTPSATSSTVATRTSSPPSRRPACSTPTRRAWPSSSTTCSATAMTSAWAMAWTRATGSSTTTRSS